MSWKHVALAGLACLLIMSAGAMVLVCGRSPTCSNPVAFTALIGVAMAMIGAAGTIIGGLFGHAQASRPVTHASAQPHVEVLNDFSGPVRGA